MTERLRDALLGWFEHFADWIHRPLFREYIRVGTKVMNGEPLTPREASIADALTEYDFPIIRKYARRRDGQP